MNRLCLLACLTLPTACLIVEAPPPSDGPVSIAYELDGRSLAGFNGDTLFFRGKFLSRCQLSDNCANVENLVEIPPAYDVHIAPDNSKVVVKGQDASGSRLVVVDTAAKTARELPRDGYIGAFALVGDTVYYETGDTLVALDAAQQRRVMPLEGLKEEGAVFLAGDQTTLALWYEPAEGLPTLRLRPEAGAEETYPLVFNKREHELTRVFWTAQTLYVELSDYIGTGNEKQLYACVRGTPCGLNETGALPEGIQAAQHVVTGRAYAFTSTGALFSKDYESGVIKGEPTFTLRKWKNVDILHWHNNVLWGYDGYRLYKAQL